MNIRTSKENNKYEMEEKTMTITKEMQLELFEVMASLITKKGAKNKMVSVFDIHDELKAKGVETSKILIEAVLDVLIQHKYVRYYKDDRRYIYFGITQLGWERWDKHVESLSSIQIEMAIGKDDKVEITLDNLTVKELRFKAKELGIREYYKATKSELIERLLQVI